MGHFKVQTTRSMKIRRDKRLANTISPKSNKKRHKFLSMVGVILKHIDYGALNDAVKKMSGARI